MLYIWTTSHSRYTSCLFAKRKKKKVMEFILLSLVTISATPIQVPLEESLYDVTIPSRGLWCCGSPCGSSYRAASPKANDVCSLEIYPHKWWFIAESSTSHYVLCFSKNPSKDLPKTCSPHVKHLHGPQFSFFSQLLRLVTFTVMVLTPALLTFVRPFDFRH